MRLNGTAHAPRHGTGPARSVLARDLLAKVDDFLRVRLSPSGAGYTSRELWPRASLVHLHATFACPSLSPLLQSFSKRSLADPARNYNELPRRGARLRSWHDSLETSPRHAMRLSSAATRGGG